MERFEHSEDVGKLGRAQYWILCPLFLRCALLPFEESIVAIMRILEKGSEDLFIKREMEAWQDGHFAISRS